jgi:hypothetical protein
MAGQDPRPAARTPNPLRSTPQPRRVPAVPRGCTQKQWVEWLKCRRSPGYFLDTYGQVYDATPGAGGDLSAGPAGWAPFRLWPAQRRICRTLQCRRLVVVLKARQLGLSWLCVGFALWLMVFHPASTVLFFSKRDDEAAHLLGFRLKGMYERLPVWMQARGTVKDNDHELRLSNGSVALAFPTTGGRSYTATLAVVDEADFAPDLGVLLSAVKPTIDAGGRLVLLSTADKSAPESAFKRVYRGALAGANDWAPVFLPWSARPGRSAGWYEEQRRDVIARTGSTDDLWQEYPSSDFEALAGRTLDKRFAPVWVDACDGSGSGDAASHALGLGPAIPGCQVFVGPAADRVYVIGADPAEGNPQSDESAASVVDALSGEQVAVLAGRFDPSVFAGHLAQLAEFYNGCEVLVERNNHGHAVLLWLSEFSKVSCLAGLDGKAGWLESGKSKPLAFDAAADAFRDGATLVRDVGTRDQLAGIEGSTLKAPEGQHDDRALAHVLALAALRWGAGSRAVGGVSAPVDVMSASDRGGW